MNISTNQTYKNDSVHTQTFTTNKCTKQNNGKQDETQNKANSQTCTMLLQFEKARGVKQWLSRRSEKKYFHVYLPRFYQFFFAECKTNAKRTRISKRSRHKCRKLFSLLIIVDEKKEKVCTNLQGIESTSDSALANQ